MKALFLTRLLVERIDPKRWMVMRPLKVEMTPSLTACDGADVPVVVVPEGFVTDFASVPRLPVAYFVAGGVGDEAAVVHDFLYHGLVPRMTADSAFLACLKACGVSWWQRQLMFSAVRAFGGSRYKET